MSVPHGCPSCHRDGCPSCYGTGKNSHFNTDDEVCQSCKGTGRCPNCNYPAQPSSWSFEYYRRLWRTLLYGDDTWRR